MGGEWGRWRERRQWCRQSQWRLHTHMHKWTDGRTNERYDARTHTHICIVSVCNERRHQCFQWTRYGYTHRSSWCVRSDSYLPSNIRRESWSSDRSFDHLQLLYRTNNVRRYQNNLRYQTTSDNIKTVYDIKPRPMISKQFTISNHVRWYQNSLYWNGQLVWTPALGV